jgi:deoxycytidine triphosphate deaminase/uncharacterized protein YbjQ (UPF0145 family)
LLDATLIRERIVHGDVFASQEASSFNIRAASVDIRIAKTRLRLPAKHGHERIYRGAQEAPGEGFDLQPGEVAFVSSLERFRLSTSLAGNIGIKFGFAGKGLLVHTGLLIHPGFGQNEEGGQPLHFIIANLSGESQNIRYGDSLASVQLFALQRPAATLGTQGRMDLENAYLSADTPLGLSFLSGINTVRDELSQVKSDFQAKTSSLTETVNTAREASQALVQFGVYIVAAAVVGVALTFYLTAADNGSLAKVTQVYAKAPWSWSRTAGLLILLSFVTYWTRALILCLERLGTRYFTSKRGRKAGMGV